METAPPLPEFIGATGLRAPSNYRDESCLLPCGRSTPLPKGGKRSGESRDHQDRCAKRNGHERQVGPKDNVGPRLDPNIVLDAACPNVVEEAAGQSSQEKTHGDTMERAPNSSGSN